MNIQDVKEWNKLDKRLKLLEKRGIQDSLTILEILSNITFFGKLKMEKCEHAKNQQCGLFFLKSETTTRIPIATKCKIKECNDGLDHSHIELSNVSCAFCPEKIE